MKTLSVHKYISIVALFILSACHHTEDKPVFVDFTFDKMLNKEGIPVDSAVSYFPETIFTDTIPCYINPSGHVTDSRFFGKDEYVKTHHGTLAELRDTFKIVTDSSYFRGVSYMLFKMNEPVLSDHYLNKNVYRIIAMRSFHNPLVIQIENQSNKVIITSRKLNRPITYPFFELSDNIIMFEPPEINGVYQNVDYDKRYEIAKRENDSLRSIYNNTNYYLTLNNQIELNPSLWDSLEVKIDSAKYWKTKPYLCMDYLQMDGSRWIIEGHFKSGYQIKQIPSPHFTKRKYPHHYDKNDYYADIFRFLIENAGLKDEDLY